MADGGLYAHAEAYQLAFSYRSFATEVSTVCGWYRNWTSIDPTTVLELAAGPADHAIEFGKRGSTVAALDISPDMLRYAADRAAVEGVSLQTIEADMVSFATATKYDLALLLIDSAAHMLDLESFVSHLKSVAACLTPDGLYLLEMTHPAEFFGAPSATETAWRMTRDDLVADFNWSTDGEVDPITQIYTARVTLDVRRAGELITSICDRFPQRLWTATEFVAAVELSSQFEIVAQYGAMDLRTRIDDRDHAWRMVSILQKRHQD